jgi:DNA processing protein
LALGYAESRGGGCKTQANMVDPFITIPPNDASAAPASQSCAPWIALGRIKGLGGVTFKKIAAHFGDAAKVFSATRAELENVEGLDRDVVDRLLGFTEWHQIDEDLRRILQESIRLITFNDPSYPARLRMIADPPPALYIKGDLHADDEKAVAVVGSRSASDYGRRVARELCRGLAVCGFTVVSGMARGIDGEAHEAALDAGGRTIAVLGSGVDRPYPPEHERLYNRIGGQGAVISELPMRTPPMAFNFPARNRLISGLSLGVVVVEATEKSGSLITASLALEQGREVFAVPGEVGASRTRGTHRLIRQGAKLVETVQDIVEEIAPQLAPHPGKSTAANERTLPERATAEARTIFALIGQRSLHVDEVIERSGFTAAKVSETLLQLELEGYLKQFPGNRYTAA